MGKLDDVVDFVVGVDTHKSSHTGAVVDVAGAVQAATTLPADAFGYRRLLTFPRAHAPARRLWAIEGTGSFWARADDVPRRAGGGCTTARSPI